MTTRQKSTLEFACFMAGFFFVWTLRATALYWMDESIASPTLRAVYANAMKLLLWVLPAAAFAYCLRRERPEKYLALSAFPNWRQWKLCLLATIGFLLAVITFEMTSAGKSISTANLAATTPAIGLLSFFVSPMFEEILFRGLVMKELLSLSSLAVANVVTSLLFAAVHLPYWLSHGGFTPAMMANVFGVFLFSLLAGWLYAKSRSVWPPTVAHILNNLVSAILLARHG
jgi:hypothetical protein